MKVSFFILPGLLQQHRHRGSREIRGNGDKLTGGQYTLTMVVNGKNKNRKPVKY